MKLPHSPTGEPVARLLRRLRIVRMALRGWRRVVVPPEPSTRERLAAFVLILVDEFCWSGCWNTVNVLRPQFRATLGLTHGIRSNTIAPTFIETPTIRPFLADEHFKASVLTRIKLGRLGAVENLMGAVVYLASAASALVTGTSLVVDGGWTAD